MTALLAGSLALITLAAATLVFGWLSTNESLIWASLFMSIAAGVLALVAEIRSRRLPASRAGSVTESETSEASG